MSHMGLSLHRGRGYSKAFKVEKLGEVEYRKDVLVKDAKAAILATRVVGLEGRPRVYIDIGIDAVPQGRIVCELFSDLVPRTAENFRALCTGEKGVALASCGNAMHYKGCPFHRICPGSYVETGDFDKGDGRGGECIYGSRFHDERLDLRHSEAGLLSMANDSSPNTNGSRFMITVAPCPKLDGKHVVFGRVVQGMDVLTRVEACGTAREGKVDHKVCSHENTPDFLVAFRSQRTAHIIDSGELEKCRGPLALQDDGQPQSKKARLEVVRGFHLLKKHRTCRRPTTWKGEAVTATLGKAKLSVENLRKRLALAPDVKKSFTELAREHSDEASAQKGGDLGLVENGSGTLEDEVEDALFKLGPGQLSEVFETKHGVHLLLRAAVD